MNDLVPTGRPSSLRLQYDGVDVSVRIRYRVGDRLTVTVNPDLTVLADIPASQPPDRALRRIQQRAAWIVRQIRFFESFKPSPAPRRYVSGETVLYAGRQYRLKVRVGPSEAIRMVRGYLVVEITASPDPRTVERLVRDWLREAAEKMFHRRLAAAVERMRVHRLSPTGLRVRRMKTRWGSCSRRGTITLHPDLVMAPPACIDYVIIHELCHLRVLRHDRRFYRLLELVLPEWRRVKARLNQLAV